MLWSMKKTVILLTGGMGSGKSTLAREVADRIPCYEADSAVKSFYEETHCAKSNQCTFLLPKIEKALGRSFRFDDGRFDSKALASVIFSNSGSLQAVESIVFPALADDFRIWRNRQFTTHDIVLFESATALDKMSFPKLWDKCIYVDAPEAVRIARVCERSGCTAEDAQKRMQLQGGIESHRERIDAVIVNNSTPEALLQRFNAALKHILDEQEQCSF